MKYYINVRFGVSNKTYYFATDFEDLKIGDFVVVETVVGLEMGEVTSYPQELQFLNYDKEVKPILRKATNTDRLRDYENQKMAEQANEIFEKNVALLNLDMKLIGSQYTLDRTKILFTYVADDRVDFRELLKLLASALKCRIELRQINARERAQLVGGIGVCGLPLCCTTFLSQFEGVTLAKVKNQMLAINIPKISGQCGKLMCCLKYEDDLYTEEKQKFPALGTKFNYQSQEFKVTGYSIFTKIIKIVSSENVEFITLDEFNQIIKHGKIKSKSIAVSKDEEFIPMFKYGDEEDENSQDVKDIESSSSSEEKHSNKPQPNRNNHERRENQNNQCPQNNNQRKDHQHSQNRPQGNQQRKDGSTNNCDKQNNERRDGQRNAQRQNRDNKDFRPYKPAENQETSQKPNKNRNFNQNRKPNKDNQGK